MSTDKLHKKRTIAPDHLYTVIVTYDNGEVTEQLVGANSEAHAVAIHIADISKWGPIRYPVNVQVDIRASRQPEDRLKRGFKS